MCFNLYFREISQKLWELAILREQIDINLALDMKFLAFAIDQTIEKNKTTPLSSIFIVFLLNIFRFSYIYIYLLNNGEN